MIGKVQQDSFQGLRIRIDADHSSGIEFDPSHSGFNSPVGSIGDSLAPGSARDCLESGRMSQNLCGYQTNQQHSPSSMYSLESTSPNSNDSQQNSSTRYKTEMCRPFQENGVCKYGEKCQFAHGQQELRTINRHPKYKTDICRTYHSVGFCPYGPRCHFIHSLDELRQQQTTPEKKVGNSAVKQLPMFGGSNKAPSNNGNEWNFPETFSADMKNAVAQLNNYFNMPSSGGQERMITAASRTNGFNSSSGSSRSGSFCSDNDSLSSPAASPPYSPDKASRLPIFSRLA